MGPEASTCRGCGIELPSALLACPSCRRLVHAERLGELAAVAAEAEARAEWPVALGRWREALELLPAASRQHATIAAKVAALGAKVDASPHPSPTTDATETANGWSVGAKAGGLGALAMFAFKFKFLLLAALTKGKLLLLGLTKGGTFLTMIAAAGVYWTAFGLPFAIGLVLSIYVHEMGHVAALRRYGVKATAPLFIPGLGAVVLLRQEFHDVRQDARVGLAGPIWGLGAALACAGVWLAGGGPLWAAVARMGAFINLFNLIPLGPLDGGRAFRALDRPQRWLVAAALATSWALTDDGVVFLLMLAAAFRALADRPADRPDHGTLAWYVALIAALSFLSFAHYPGLGVGG